MTRRGSNLVFYGCWRAHQAIFLLLPDGIRRWLAWTLVSDAPWPVRRLLSRLGRALRRVTGWGE